MSTHFLRLCGALLAAALASLLMAQSASAAANKVAADLRVVAPDGTTLIDKRQITGTTSVKTSPQANCFGDGTGGSGDKAKVPGPTALGAVADASRNVKALRPLSITDAFDFGLGVCGFGGYVAPQTGFWYLKRNHAATQTGGDQTTVANKDHILWYLIEDFNAPVPAELELRAPAKVPAGEPFTVKVVEYADDGAESPAAGASVGGVLTDANGQATIDPGGGKKIKLQATRTGAIPSQQLTVCQLLADAGCQTGHVLEIGGTQKNDKIKSGKGPAKIRSYAGNDKVDVRKSKKAFPVKVDCGGGKKDVLKVAKRQQFTEKGCETIKKR